MMATEFSSPMFSRSPWPILPLTVACIFVAPLRAQHIGVGSLPILASESDERVRLAELSVGTPSNWYLIRSPSRVLTNIDSAPAWRIGVVAPEFHSVHNSQLPYSLNEGSLWAGVGWNQEVTGGVFARLPHFRLIVAPTFVSEENQPFQIIPYPQNLTPPRSVWANPFHPLPESIDLPLRFGDRRREHLDPGQSIIETDAYGFSLGFGTENLWWGPGIRNAITISNNAPGFPHAYLQTTRPLHTAAGIFDAQWIFGTLRESDFFDTVSTNNTRTVSGMAVTWSPPGDSGLTLGGARIVMTSQANNHVPLESALDLFRFVGHPNTDTTVAIPVSGATDQIFSVFARWVFPSPGFEAYVEWARFEEPLSFRDFLEYPGHSEGYTLGFQWAHPMSNRKTFRLQSEASYLEPDPSLRLRPTAVTYTSRAVPQGFTNRGETLGAAIGPGASSQWLAGDVFAPWWRFGAFLNRIRWDNGTLFEPIVPQFKRQDVTLSAGLRGSVMWRGMNLLVSLEHAARFDYLFQAYVLPGINHTGGIDLLNNTLSLTLSTGVGRS